MMMQIGSEQANWQGSPRTNMVNSIESCASEYRGLSSTVSNGYYGSGHARSHRVPYNSSYVGLNGGYSNDSNGSVHYSHYYGPNEPVSTSSASPEDISNSHSPISYTSNSWNGNDHRQSSMAYATTPRHHYPHAFNNSAAFLPSTGSTPHAHSTHHQQQYFSSGGCAAGYMNTPFPLDMSGKSKNVSPWNNLGHSLWKISYSFIIFHFCFIILYSASQPSRIKQLYELIKGVLSILVQY